MTAVLQSDHQKCGWCGLYHGPTCFRVKAIEYHPNGTVRRVELREPWQHPETNWGPDVGKEVWWK